MIRYLFVILLSALGTSGMAQPYSNEWIDYSKTYYKFPVVTEGLFRISKTALIAGSAELGNANAQSFQLWRDGQEQPLYTSEASGPLASNGYLEFYGRPLDGSQDAALFANPENHVFKDLSFFSDTAWYFLTINNATPNLRFSNETNTVATTQLVADSFFMYTRSIDFFRGPFQFNYSFGYGVAPEKLPSQLVVRSSVWDQGEGFASTPFDKNGLNININGMQAYKKGAGMKLFTSVIGSWNYNRNISVAMNDSVLWSVYVPNFQLKKTTIDNIPMSRIVNDAVVMKYKSDVDTWPERSQVNALYLTYPRVFNFSNQYVFSLELNANSNGNHLRIGGFNAGGKPAILLDFANLKRYAAVNKGADSVLFALQGSATNRKLVVANQDNGLRQIQDLKAVNFTDFTKAQNQGDYLIITSDRLRMYNNQDMVEAYKQYRSSEKGGNYNVKVINVEELYDQFALGVRKNPLAIRRFAQFVVNKFSVKPKYVLLLGRAVDYLVDRYSGSYFGREFLNSVPSWGSPCSDNLLLAAPGLDPTPLIPVGRVAATNGKEIADYLEKVKQYELLSSTPDFSPANKEWKKEAVQMVGGDDAYFSSLLNNFMTSYRKIVTDTLVGAKVTSYVKVNNANYANDVKDLTERINKGVGLINYFGHSSATSIDFNLASPDDFTNSNGKYPVFIVNGCQAGNIFFANSNRLSYYGLSISERFVFAPNKGAIAFVSNSDYGLYNYLNLYTQLWLRGASRLTYGKGLGTIQQFATKNAISVTGTSEFFNRLNCEQSLLHGDPAIVMFGYEKPDYAVTDSMVDISPANATVAEDSLNVKIGLLNLGKKGSNDSVWVDVKREFPDGTQTTVAKYQLRKLSFKDSVSLKIGIKGLFDKGTNYLVVTIDPANQVDEMSKANNVARVPFEVSDEEIRPVYPYAFSIVNKPGIRLKGSTVNAVEDTRTYRLQVDTTELFNSPALYSKDTTVKGGVVEFSPSVSWKTGTVYFWRLAPVFNGKPVNWSNSSFQYIQGSAPGWGQSHFFQYAKSTFKKTTLDSTTRAFKFGGNTQNLYLISSVYGYSGDEDNHFSVSINGLTSIYSACVGQSIIFNIFDTLTLAPWTNYNQRFGSGPYCAIGRGNNFEFPYFPASNRKKIMDFLDSIPKGMIVTARLILDAPFDSSLVKYWKSDTAIFGPGKSLYHSLYKQGFYLLDSMTRYRTFNCIFKKDDSVSLKPMSRLSDGLYDRLNASYFVNTLDTAGEVASPAFGPASSWTQMQWKGHQPQVNQLSSGLVQLIGINSAKQETVLRTFLPEQWNNDISDINAAQYPYLKLKLITGNSKEASPYQLDYWRLLYQPVAEGALSARDHYKLKPFMITGKDSLNLEIAFKNISDTYMDSSSVRVTIAGRDSGKIVFDLPKLKPLKPSDTAIVVFSRNTAGMLGKYYAYVQVNRENNPLEQTLFNNAAYIPFEVNTVLPVSLIEFTAKGEKTAVSLNWKVSAEKDVDGYIVEHSDSKSKSFATIGTVKAANLGGTQDYNLMHETPSEGANYYRIKTVYKTGNIEYSPVRQVYFSREGKVSMYPNPFSQAVYVNTAVNALWQVEIFTVQGQRVLVKTGKGSSMINTAHLPAGAYLVKITDGEGTTSLKFEKHQ